MTFVCILGTEEFAPPLVERNGSSHLVLIPIGYDLDDDKSYLLMVTFDVLPGGLYELAFGIVEHDGEHDSDYTYWDGLELRAKIPSADDRAKILSVLLAVSRYLIDIVKPDEAIMCTHVAGLPKKALRKFEEVCSIIRTCGYDIADYDEYHGQVVWRMVRRK